MIMKAFSVDGPVSPESLPSVPGNDDHLLALRRYKHVYHRYKNDGIIDLDQRLKHQCDFQIYPLGDAVRELSGEVPPTRQTPYWIVLVRKGIGEKSIGQFTFPIKDNTLFIVPKRVIHSSKYFTTDCEGYQMMFNIDFFLNAAFPKQCINNRKVLRNSSRPYLYLNKFQAETLSEIFESIMQEHTINWMEKKEMIAIKVLELLIQCDRLFTDAELTGGSLFYHPVIEQFAELVESHFNRERSVQFYANTLRVHPNHLNFLLKKHSGLNAKESIDKRIILESKYLLNNSSMIIKEVAYELGFDDPNNFSTFFQKHAGRSPVAYRNASHRFAME